ncbi:uncharacterized protein ZBIST_1454 [Zygosaccharomyces bailii]|nr:uncharacterized protein ZBIST_1454 [Zygosaccharomyces bailii]
MSGKRGRRAASASLEPEGERPAWQRFCSDETLVQWHKLRSTESMVVTARERVGELLGSWAYHVVVSWLYKVCDSFVTVSYAGDIDTFKPLWRDVKFDEELLLQELSGLAEDSTLWESLRWQLLKQVANSRNVKLKDWDELATHYLNKEGATLFAELSLVEQFQELYGMIRVVERRNLPFRNYLVANLQLFEPVVYEENQKDEATDSLLALANVGVLVRKIVRQNPVEHLQVPLKLGNCTVKLRDGDNMGFEIVHLDYGSEIDRYLQTVTVEYQVVTKNWDEFAQCVERHVNGENCPDVDYQDLVNVYVEHQLYSRRLLQHRQKEQEMQELLTRRKRSSRLVAREEQVRQRDLESEWLDRLDARDQHLRKRHRLVARQKKKIDDLLWNQLWSSFEKDSRNMRLEPAVSLNDTLLPSDWPELNTDDREVLKRGSHYVQSLCPAPLRHDIGITPLELPLPCCVTEEDVARGVAKEADDLKWAFECPGESDQEALWIGNVDEEEAHADLLSRGSLVCCEMCLTWQHWECQPPQLLSLLGSVVGRDTPVTARDFALVQVGHAAVQPSRRSSRRAAMSDPTAAGASLDSPVEPNYLRPTDKRRELGEAGVFFCCWCVHDAEQQLRATFPKELSAVRAKQRRHREEREQRRQAAVSTATPPLSHTPVHGTFSTGVNLTSPYPVNSDSNGNGAATASGSVSTTSVTPSESTTPAAFSIDDGMPDGV